MSLTTEQRSWWRSWTRPTRPSLKWVENFSSLSHSWIWSFILFIRSDILSVMNTAAFQRSVFKSTKSKILMWSPVASQKITPFFSCVRLELYSLKPKAENKWEVPLASISLVFIVSWRSIWKFGCCICQLNRDQLVTQNKVYLGLD